MNIVILESVENKINKIKQSLNKNCVIKQYNCPYECFDKITNCVDKLFISYHPIPQRYEIDPTGLDLVTQIIDNHKKKELIKRVILHGDHKEGNLTMKYLLEASSIDTMIQQFN